MQTRKKMNNKSKTLKRKSKILKRKSKTLAGNYNLIRGNFEIYGDIKSKHRKTPLVFGNHQWGRLTNWIASETLIKSTFDIDQLIENMSHKDVNISIKAKRDFCGRVARAIILGDSDYQFMHGESSSNFPKIKEKKYTTIKLGELAKILMDHREKIRKWNIGLESKQKKKNTSKAAENTSKAAENTSKAAENTSLKISQNSVPNNWEDLE